MAWDVEGTKQRLLDAGTREFCDHGLSGARVDRIAARAGVNKERIYQYFGKKDAFFDIVVARALASVMDEVPFIGSGPEALGDYAGRLFDRHVRDQTMARLIFWEGLERGGEPVIGDERHARRDSKIATVCEMLPGCSPRDAGDLLITIMTLCDGWVLLRGMDELFSGAEGADRVTERRARIVTIVTAAARAVQASERDD